MLNILISLLMAGLALDLLYLYFAGGWIEPVAWIKFAELVSLVAIFTLGIIRSIQQIKEFRRCDSK